MFYRYKLLLSILEKLFIYSVGIVPNFVKYFLITVISKIGFSLSKKTKVRSIHNIKRVYPHYTESQVRQLAVASLRNVVAGMLDCFIPSKLTFEFEMNAQARAMLTNNEGAIIATLHMGCFEAVPFAMQQLTSRSTTLCNIPKELKHANMLYQSYGVDCINKKDKNHFLNLLKKVKSNRVITLHSDQRGKDVEISFFGETVTAPAGAASLASLAKAPLLISYAIPVGIRRYRVVVKVLQSDIKGVTRLELTETTQAIYKEFEKIICTYPEYYYWAYNRWG